MQAALLIREKQRLRRKKYRRGRADLPSHVATKEIGPFPQYPPGFLVREKNEKQFKKMKKYFCLGRFVFLLFMSVLFQLFSISMETIAPFFFSLSLVDVVICCHYLTVFLFFFLAAIGQCSQGRAAWQERERISGGGRRCSNSDEARHQHRIKQTEAHHRWMKRNRVSDGGPPATALLLLLL